MSLDDIDKENLLNDLKRVFSSHNILASIKIEKDEIVFSLIQNKESKLKDKDK